MLGYSNLNSRPLLSNGSAKMEELLENRHATIGKPRRQHFLCGRRRVHIRRPAGQGRCNIYMIEAKAFRTFIRIYSLFKGERFSANIKLTLDKALVRLVMTLTLTLTLAEASL
jgi:hypothetical protein